MNYSVDVAQFKGILSNQMIFTHCSLCDRPLCQWGESIELASNAAQPRTYQQPGHLALETDPWRSVDTIRIGHTGGFPGRRTSCQTLIPAGYPA